MQQYEYGRIEMEKNMFSPFLFYQPLFKGWNDGGYSMMVFFQETVPSWYNMLKFHHNERYDTIQVQLWEEHILRNIVCVAR